jgi:hypothetical protein
MESTIILSIYLFEKIFVGGRWELVMVDEVKVAVQLEVCR